MSFWITWRRTCHLAEHGPGEEHRHPPVFQKGRAPRQALTLMAGRPPRVGPPAPSRRYRRRPRGHGLETNPRQSSEPPQWREKSCGVSLSPSVSAGIILDETRPQSVLRTRAPERWLMARKHLHTVLGSPVRPRRCSRGGPRPGSGSQGSSEQSVWKRVSKFTRSGPPSQVFPVKSKTVWQLVENCVLQAPQRLRR